MSTAKYPEPDAKRGAPLAVCVNDCQLDYGQPASELAPVCFQVGCAFAEMRWGSSSASPMAVIIRGNQRTFEVSG
jgi:hypothetical protein